MSVYAKVTHQATCVEMRAPSRFYRRPALHPHPPRALPPQSPPQSPPQRPPPVAAAHLRTLAVSAQECDNLVLVGLMTIGRYGEDCTDCFECLATNRDRATEVGVGNIHTNCQFR